MNAGMEFYSPVKMLAGECALDNIAVELASWEARKPLVIARSGEQGSWAVRALVNAFGETGVNIGVFAGVGGIPTLEVIKDIYDVYTTRGFDVLIAAGGGEVVHTAKIANVAVSLTPAMLRSMLASPAEVCLSGEQSLPLIVIPDLVMDGYECSKYVLFADRRYASPFFIPDMVVMDKYAISGVFAQAAARSSAVAMMHALDSYTCAKRSPFSDAYAASLLSMLITGVTAANTARVGKWKLSFVNALALAGCLFSNTENGVGYGLSFALSRATDVPAEECSAALLMALAQLAIKKQGAKIGAVLMALLDVDSPQTVHEALLDTCSKIVALANVNWEAMNISKDEQTVIAERVSGGIKKEECLDILQGLSEKSARKGVGR